jgi:hypothetical protein
MRFFPWNNTDPDAAAYIAAVEVADGQALEGGVKAAINNLFIGLKTDGEWNAFSVLRCYAGPRTLAGCAVPLKGVAPTLVNFVSGDINRKTGLIGNGATKYVNHNHSNSANPQNSQQMWSYLTAAIINNSQTQAIIGVGITQTGISHIGRVDGATEYFSRSQNAVVGTAIAIGAGVGLVGISRSNSASYQVRANGTTQTNVSSSQTPASGNVFSFARNNSGVISPSNHRAAFDCVGAGWIDSANIEARITTYLAALNAALP